MMWQYKLQDITHYSEHEITLNLLGLDGWELVAVDQGYAFLKRPVTL